MTTEHEMNKMLEQLSQFKEYNREILEQDDKELMMNNGIPWLLFNKETIVEYTMAYKIQEYRNENTLFIAQEGDNGLLAIFNDKNIEFVVNELGNLDEENDIIIDHTPNVFCKNVDLLNIYEPAKTINQNYTIDNITALIEIIEKEISTNSKLGFLTNALHSDIRTIKHTVFNKLNLSLLIMYRMVIDNNMMNTKIDYLLQSLSALQTDFNQDNKPYYFQTSADINHFVEKFNTTENKTDQSTVNRLKMVLKIQKNNSFIVFSTLILLIIFRLLQKIMHVQKNLLSFIILFIALISLIALVTEMIVRKKVNKLNAEALNTGLITPVIINNRGFLSLLKKSNAMLKVNLPKNVKPALNIYLPAKKIEFMTYGSVKPTQVTNCTVRFVSNKAPFMTCYKTEIGSTCFTISANSKDTIFN